MNDFDDVQQKAQEMTASVTNGSPAKTITPPSNTADDSFSYAGYGEQEQNKTKTTGGTKIVSGRKDDQFAVPYAGGGSYPGSVLYGAEVHSDDSVVNLKSKYAPVEPFDIQIGNMSGKVDTLNMKKAFYELAYMHTPRTMDYGMWYGYDREIVEPTENFWATTGRTFANMPGQIVGTAGAAIGWVPATFKTVYGELTNDDELIQLGNDMLEATRDSTNDFLSHTTFSYGEMGSNVGQNKYGAVLGSIGGSIPIGVIAGIGPASTFAAFEGLSNAYEARYAAFDRGVSGLGGLSIALGAGGATAALGVSTKWVEKPLKGLYKPTLGWARALKENPKEFMKQAFKKNFVTGAYDGAITESAQDLITAWLGNGRVDAEDWEQAWITAMFGTVVGAAAAAVKTKADKKTQQFYNDSVRDMYVSNKGFFDKLIKESNGGITQETVDMWFDFLANGNTADGFVSYLKTKIAENIDKYDSMPDEFKQRIESIIQAKDGVIPLAAEMKVLDANIDNVLNNVEDLGDTSKQIIRQILRGIALYEYMYNGVNPSEFGLPTIVADLEPGKSVYTDKDGVIHLNKGSSKDLEPIGQKQANVDQSRGANYQKSAMVKNEALLAARRSPNASFETPRGKALPAHELFHWMEKKTGLPKVADFMQRLNAWTEQVLPGITSGKGEGTVERSEAYAYAMQYARSLKGMLGLSGDMRKYIDMFNAISAANIAAAEFENYNAVLAQEIKRNSKTLDDLLASYGEDKLRDVIKQYAETGNLGLLKQEDLARLFEVMESVVDSQTIEKMNVAFGDRSTAKSFIDRYEEEYDVAQEAIEKRAALAKNVVKAQQQQHSKSSTQQSTELQKYIVDAAMVEEESVSSKEEKTETPAEGPKPEGNTETQVAEGYVEALNEAKVVEETPDAAPYMQYTGEIQPLVRPKEEATWIERWLSGEKIPVDVYANLVEEYTALAKRLVGIVPTGNTKYIVRQHQGDGAKEGVMTAVWTPTGTDLEAIGLPANSINMMNSRQLAAVGRVLALRDAENVYSIEDDIVDITGGGNDNAFYDLLTAAKNPEALRQPSLPFPFVKDVKPLSFDKDKKALTWVNDIEDVVNNLQGFSGNLTHSGTNLNLNDAMYEMSLIERALRLTHFHTEYIKNEDVRAAIEKVIKGINVKSLAGRKNYLAQQIAAAQKPDDLSLFLPPEPQEEPKYKDPWGKKSRPIDTVLDYGLGTLDFFRPSYWIKRMGLDVDKYQSVEVLEKYVTDKGLAPVDFSGVTVDIAGRQVPLFEPRETQPAEFGALYGHQGVNQAVNMSFDLKALRHILNGRPSRMQLVSYLLEHVKNQLNPDTMSLSLEEKLREIAAIGRAKMIADDVFAQYNDTISKFAQWATLSAKGRIAKGADLEGIQKETKQQNFEKLQEQEISAGRDPYIARKDLDVMKLPSRAQVAFLYSGSWKQGVITAAEQTDSENPFYVIRVLNDGDKGTYDLVWDAREFELLQKATMGKYESALFIKPTKMSKEEFTKIVSEGYWNENYNYPVSAGENIDDNKRDYNFTGLVAHSRVIRNHIPKLVQFGNGETVLDDTSNLYSVSGDELMNLEDPFADMPDEYFENIDNEAEAARRQRTITGEEKSNQEVYEKLKMAEEERRKPVTRYLERNVPGFGKSIVNVMQDLKEGVKNRKLSSIAFFLTGGSGPQAQATMLWGDKVAKQFGFNLMADRAERVARDFKKDVELALLDRTFKNQKELGEWSVRIGVDLDGVKAVMDDGFERPISRDEIMALYLAELSKDGKNEELSIPYMYGGTIEENGNTYIYNRLRETYKNFDELIGNLTEQDKAAAKILFRFMPILRGVDMNDKTSWFGKFVPVNVFSDYASAQDGGWGNRRSHNTAVFGTRLLNPNAKLVAVGLYNSAMNMAGGAGVRAHNYLQPLQMLSDMLNLAALADEDVRYSRGFRVAMDENEEAQLKEAIALSEEIKQLIADKIGTNNFKSFMASIADCLSKDQGGVAKTPVMEFFQKLTRSASAMALSLKPRQIFTNLHGNYIVMGGLSSHTAAWYNTVGYADAVAHGKEAWEDMKNNATFVARLEQSALAEQYQRVADTKAPSLLQDAEKKAFEKGMYKTGNVLAYADAAAKTATKWSIGLTNTAPDVVGLALGRWVVLNDVKARIAAQAAAEGRKMTEEQIDIAAENEIADYMFSHISSSNVMARGRISKAFARAGFEGVAAFKNDKLQKTAALSNAWARYVNSDDKNVRAQCVREIEGIVLSDLAYVAIQSGVIYALYRSLTGQDMSDKEKEYVHQSFLREMVAQLADTFNGGALTQPLLEAFVFGRESGLDFLPYSDLKRIARNVRKGKYLEMFGTMAGLAGFSPAERAIQVVRALSMVFGDDEYASSVGWLMLAGRSESTAKNMLGLTTNKKGELIKKKSRNKKD